MLYIIVIWVSESSISSALFAFVSSYHFFVLIEYQCIASSLRQSKSFDFHFYTIPTYNRMYYP